MKNLAFAILAACGPTFTSDSISSNNKELQRDGWTDDDAYAFAEEVYADGVVTVEEAAAARQLADEVDGTSSSLLSVRGIADYAEQLIGNYWMWNTFAVIEDGVYGVKGYGRTMARAKNGRFWITEDASTAAKPRRPMSANELWELQRVVRLAKPRSSSDPLMHEYERFTVALEDEIIRTAGAEDAALLDEEARLNADGWQYLDYYDIADVAYADGVLSASERITLRAMGNRHPASSAAVSFQIAAQLGLQDVNATTHRRLVSVSDGGSVGMQGLLPGNPTNELGHGEPLPGFCLMLDHSLAAIDAKAQSKRFFVCGTDFFGRPASLWELQAFQSILDTIEDNGGYRERFEAQLDAEIARLKAKYAL